MIYRAFSSNSYHEPSLRITKQASNRTSFGDDIAESMEPVSQISAQYGILNDLETFNATGGTVTTSDNMYVCSTGTNVGGYGVIRTKRPTIYREGQGLMTRFTALFDSANAVANSLQFAGLFSGQDTIAFGYRGTDFGILFDTYGSQEIRKLTFTAATSGNLSLTLNSVLYTIPLTTGTNAFNAYEVEAWLNANQSVWDAQQVGDSVFIRNRNSATAGGTYSVTGAGFTGTLTQEQSGAAKTESTILEADWNGESVSFDKSKGNVFMIKVPYLGFGPISFFIMDSSGEFKRVHTIKYQNNNTKPSLSNRALKVGWTAASLGSTADIKVKGASAGTFIEGRSVLNRIAQAKSNENASVGNTFEAILTLKALESFNGKAMLGRIVIERLGISTDASKEVVVKLLKNATLGTTNYIYHSEGESVVIYDTGNHADTGNAHAIYGTQVSGGGDREVSLKDIKIDFYANETITVYAKVVSGAAANVTATLVWREDL
jgi:hypothetical protein